MGLLGTLSNKNVEVPDVTASRQLFSFLCVLTSACQGSKEEFCCSRREEEARPRRKSRPVASVKEETSTFSFLNVLIVK